MEAEQTAICEFMAEEELVTIVPKFRHDRLHFISGNFGPFEPQTQVQVPLWLALLLRKRQHCTIVIPAWLSLARLQATLEEETASQDSFSGALPFHYAELAALLFDGAVADVADAEEARSTLEDVQSARFAKIRAGMRSVATQARNDETTNSIKMNSIGAIEIAQIQPLLLDALDKFYALRAHAEPRHGLSQADDAAPAGAADDDVAPPPEKKRTLRRFR
ncbi:hypothetical protein M885DRAFT_623005 [Pelagophyceae sp. CCMP2097]|nr:hypothetical protein M885DRAFT_623005 [Pelagophyceae sp. CCMP2097]